jgi:hypothetical protein
MREPSVAVTSAIAAAAQLNGVSARYLTAAAARESAFNAEAQAATSSAAGLYQFIESTWLTTLSRHAERLGLQQEAQLEREDALALRFDPRLSALLAGALTADNAEVLKERLGRPPSDGELYAAHVLGAGGAAGLARAVRADPKQSAAALFPAAARANHDMFHDDAGTPFSVASLAERFDRLMREENAAPTAAAAAAAAAVAAPTSTALASEPAPVLALPARTVLLRGASAPLRLHPETVEILAALEPPDRAKRSDKA